MLAAIFGSLSSTRTSINLRSPFTVVCPRSLRTAACIESVPKYLRKLSSSMTASAMMRDFRISLKISNLFGLLVPMPKPCMTALTLVLPPFFPPPEPKVMLPPPIASSQFGIRVPLLSYRSGESLLTIPVTRTEPKTKAPIIHLA